MQKNRTEKQNILQKKQSKTYTSEKPPTARIPSTKRLYSLNSSPTSERRRSSGVHSINLFFGGAKRSSDDDVIRLEGALVERPTSRLLFALCWRRMEEGPGEPTGDVY